MQKSFIVTFVQRQTLGCIYTPLPISALGLIIAEGCINVGVIHPCHLCES